MFALDTNTVSFVLRGEGRVADRLQATDPAHIGIPSVVLHELRYGMLRAGPPQRRWEEVEAFLACIAVMPLDAAAAAAAAEIRVRLERRGEKIGPFDILIAGTALAQGATLVTHNMREFSRVDGLPVEDWY